MIAYQTYYHSHKWDVIENSYLSGENFVSSISVKIGDAEWHTVVLWEDQQQARGEFFKMIEAWCDEQDRLALV